MPAPGQLSKLTPELQTKIFSLIADGNYIETACQACGITRETLSEYNRRAMEALEKPEQERNEYELRLIDFSDAIKKAHADAEARLVSKIMKSPANQFANLAWILERTRQDKYALKTKLDISTKEPIKVTFERVKESK